MDIVKQFAERIRELREKMGLSQSEFANKLGVSRGSISFYENASRTPDIYFLSKVYDYFDEEISMEYLLGYTDNIKRENEMLGLQTGLTDESIDGLECLDSEFLNELLTNKKFFQFAFLLNRYVDSHTDKSMERLGIVDFTIADFDYRNDMMAYLFGEYFKEIMCDVCEKIRVKRKLKIDGIDINSMEDLKKYSDKVFSTLNEKIEKFEREEEEYRKKYEAEYEIYKQTPEYKERQQKRERLKALIADLDKKQGDDECPQ